VLETQVVDLYSTRVKMVTQHVLKVMTVL